MGSFILSAIVIGAGWALHLNKREKESQLKIEKFLEDYRALKPSRYSYADIKRITNHFKDKLGQGGYGTVFKGKLCNDVLVAVKVLNNFKGNGEEFINEVGSMGRIHHVNVTRLVGFCADGCERALVYEYLPNESLEKYIFGAKSENRSLNWEKLQDIALGVAKSFRMLLLEMVGGRKNIDVTVENTSQVYFPEWAYNRLDKREELRIRIENEEQTGIVKKLTIVGLWCIQWYPVDRPSVKVVVQMLGGESNILIMPPNPFASTDEAKKGTPMPRKPVNRELATISELE
ncbi:hypothetical protein DITRI_Ditri07aG0095600 [Diplodiscus trichospermus]